MMQASRPLLEQLWNAGVAAQAAVLRSDTALLYTKYFEVIKTMKYTLAAGGGAPGGWEARRLVYRPLHDALCLLSVADGTPLAALQVRPLSPRRSRLPRLPPSGQIS